MNSLPFAPDRPWLAPLAGYSDLPFRMLCRQYGCAGAFTEMISAKGLVYENTGTNRLLATCPKDKPLVVQLFGSEPDTYPPIMNTLIEQGFTHFDLNSGCPVKKVLKSGSGSALLTHPKKLVRIVREMVNTAGAGNVGVKIRLGFNMNEDIFIDLSKELEQEGVGWITLHPRYAKQMFMGKADWSKLAELRKAVAVPIIGSGDLFTALDAVRCLDETGIQCVMFARGALYNPSIFEDFAILSRGGQPEPLDGEKLSRMVGEHIRLTRELDGCRRSFRKIRSIIPRYAKGLENIRALRSRLAECSDWDELEKAAREIALLKRVDKV